MALGKLQKNILSTMGRHPLGGWPRKWTLGYRDRQLMLGLQQRQLVRERPDDPAISWVLTPAGRAAVDAQPRPTYPARVAAPDIAPVLTRRQAWRLDAQVQVASKTVADNLGTLSDNLADLSDLVHKARAGQIHIGLGLPSWTAWFADRVSAPLMAAGDRQVVALMLHNEGLSHRVIGQTLGVSQPTVHNDIKAAKTAAGQQGTGPGKTIGRDGKNYTRSRKKPKRQPKKMSATVRLHTSQEHLAVSLRNDEAPADNRWTYVLIYADNPGRVITGQGSTRQKASEDARRQATRTPFDAEQHDVIAAIRSEMARSGVLQRDLAEALGLSQQAVSRRLVGAVQFTIEEIEIIADTIGCPVSRILGMTLDDWKESA